MSNTTDDELLTLLQRGDPASGSDVSAASVRRLLSDSITSAMPSPRRRARRRNSWFAGGIAGALALGLATPAVTSVVAEAEWGEVSVTVPAVVAETSPDADASLESASSPENTDNLDIRGQTAASVSGPGSEFVVGTGAMAIGNIPAYISFPDEKGDSIDYGLALLARSSHALVYEATSPTTPTAASGPVRDGIVEIESGARCAWTREWLTADSEKDDRRAVRAAAVLRVASGWPATKALGADVVDRYRQVAKSAKKGDAAVVRNEFLVDCTAVLLSPREPETE